MLGGLKYRGHVKSKKEFRLKRRWVVLISCLVIMTSLYVFRYPIFRTSVETYLSMKMRGYGGWKFSCEHVKLKRDGICFNQVSFKTRGVGATVAIQNLGCIFEKSRGLHFKLRFLIEEPIIEVEKLRQGEDFTLASLMRGPLEKYKVDISDGLIKFVDAEGRADIYFSLEGDDQRRSAGVFYLSERSPRESKASAMVKLYQWPKELIIESELESASLIWLSRIVNFFEPNSLKDWCGLQGVISGHSWIGFDDQGQILQTKGDLEVNSFACARKSGEFELKMEEMSLDFSFPSGGKRIDKKEAWWQSLALKSQLVGGEARFKDAEWGADFTISEIGGSLNFSTFKDSQIELKGLLNQSGEVSPIILSGSPSLSDSETLDIDMRLYLEAEGGTSTHLNLSLSALEKNEWLVRGQLKEIDAPQIKMFQHFIGFAMPEVKGVHFDRGALTCDLSLVIAEGRISKLLLEDMIADEVEIYWTGKDVSTSAKKVSGSAQLDFLPVEKFKFPSWRIKITEGEVIKGVNSDHPLKFSDIDMAVFMCRDVFEPSWARAKVEDVLVDLNIVGFYSEANVKVNLVTSLERAIQFFDPSECSAIKEKFNGYGLAANFDLHRQLGFWDVSGNLKLDVKGDWVDQIDLGFFLSDQILKYEQKKLPDLLQESISKGIFKGKNISCEGAKIVKHFTGGAWDLEGMISLEGVFSAKSIDAEIDTSYLNLSTPFVDVRLNSVLDMKELTTSEGKFHFDFGSNLCQAYLPFYGAIIAEKRLGLLFTDTKGQLYTDGKLLRFEEVSTETEGLSVQGMLEMKFPKNQEPLTLTVVTSEISGNSDGLESLLRTIEPLKKLKFPFAGTIKSGESGLNLSMKFPHEGAVGVNWEAECSLLSATMPLTDEFSLKDFRFNCRSVSEENQVHISQVSGRLITPRGNEEYMLTAKEIDVDYSDELGIDVTFDLRLENSMMDLVRLIGGYDGKQKKVFIEDDISHFFGSKLKGIKVVFSEEESQYQLKEFCSFFSLTMEEIGIASRIGLDLGVGGSLLELIELQSNALSGKLEGAITFVDEIWKMDLDGYGLTHAEMGQFPLSLKLELGSDTLQILDSHLGVIDLVGSVRRFDQGFSIEQLVVALEGHKVAFGQGVWDQEKKRLSLPLKGGKIDLSSFIDWGPVLMLDGQFELGYIQTARFPFSVLYEGEVVIEHKGIDKFTIASNSPVHIEYNHERGFLVKDSSFCLEDGKYSLGFSVPTLVFLTDEKLCQGYRIKTTLTSDLIHYFTKETPFASQVNELIVPQSNGWPFEILFDFEYAKDRMQLGGLLPKGVYQFKGQKYDLEEMQFHFSDHVWEVSGGINLFGKGFGIHLRTHPSKQYETIVEMFHLPNSEGIIEGSNPGLYMEVKLGEDQGVALQKIEGDLFGLDFHFVPKLDLRQQNDHPIFLGNIKMNMQKMIPLLNKDIKALVDELKLDRGYELSGELVFQEPHFKKPVFEGYFKAKDFDLLGYQLKTCFSSIHIDENGADLHELKISDDAVTIDLKEMKMKPTADGDISIDAPELLIHDLRPSLLQKRGKIRGRIKPFHIKNMVFNDVIGFLSDPKTLKGKGSLNFVNTFKQGTNLLDIPIEIISRLGLDTGLLVPIQGEMEYTLKGGKLVFNKLKNSYSDSKRSYFFLWNKSESYVDLEGNIHIDIRMKQYVLFKITELFVLSINGTLEHPKFSLK